MSMYGSMGRAGEALRISAGFFVLALIFGIPLGAYSACIGGACAATSTENTTFTGNLYVNGSVSKGSGTFVIDHPLDPKNKLLFHSFVESPDMKNLYDGVATLDKNGETTITLPGYFVALNKEYRYLATALGEPMPGLYLSEGVHQRFFNRFGPIQFSIRGGSPGGRVSWQVTGTRQDPLAATYPIVVEVDKDSTDLVGKGQYLHPDAYGL